MLDSDCVLDVYSECCASISMSTINVNPQVETFHRCMNEGMFPGEMEFTIDDEVNVVASCYGPGFIEFSGAVVLGATTAAAAAIVAMF